ncbi:MAG: hypothetical protein DRP01_00390 [Archaeoglobales archaeon]|nr:MAG: hypothetical protein DRP01_00390 [Archaeoglobales archaeon]
MSYAERYDIPSGNISEIKEQLKFAMEHKAFRGVWCLVGEAGMGKSQIVHQVAEEMGATVCDVRTAHFGLMGTGIPSVKDAKGENFFKIKLPEIFPGENEKVILNFDELNQGQAHAISMFFSMIEDRKMFDYMLPKDTLVVATMNPNTEQYAVTQIENNAALRRRLKFVYVIPSAKEFLKHAASENFHSTDVDIEALGGRKPCHPAILEYFETKPTEIDNKRARESNKSYVCPATIQTISMNAYLLEQEKIPLEGSFAYLMFASSIGQASASSISAFMKDSATAINPLDVLERYSKVKKKVDKLISSSNNEVLMELNMNVLSILFSKCPANITRTAKNFVKFIVDQPTENTGSIMYSIRKVAEDNGSEDYLKDLMREMYQHDEWVEAHKNMDEAHRAVDQDFRSGKAKA